MTFNNRKKARTGAGFTARIVTAVMILVAVPVSSFAAVNFLVPDDVRLVSAARKFDDTSQFAVAYRSAAPRVLRADHVEFAMGTIFTSEESHPFVSYGPVWRFPLRGPSTYVDFGFSPTVLSGSTFNGRELGGKFHFTSSLELGMRFGTFQQFSLSLRGQHTSNGGINGTNPGLDMIGVAFALEFRD